MTEHTGNMLEKESAMKQCGNTKAWRKMLKEEDSDGETTAEKMACVGHTRRWPNISVMVLLMRPLNLVSLIPCQLRNSKKKYLIHLIDMRVDII